MKPTIRCKCIRLEFAGHCFYIKASSLSSALKWLCIAIAGYILFTLAHIYASQQRGYNAVGGEYLLLFLPLWWWLAEIFIEEMRYRPWK